MVKTLKVAVFDVLAAYMRQPVMITSPGPGTMKLIKSFCRGSRGPHGMGDLLERALLSSMFYPRPYALGSRLNLFKRAPLVAEGKKG